MGPADVCLRVGAAINYWEPNYVVQTGVAWGSKESLQQLGDLIFAAKVVGYGNNTRRGKEKDDIRDDIEGWWAGMVCSIH